MKILGMNISRARERKENPVWTAVLSMSGGADAIYTPADYNKLAKAGYQQCASAFSAVTLIARSCAGIGWVVSRKRTDGTLVELDKHALLDLLSSPNEYDDGYRLIEAIVSYKLLAGNSYVLKVGVGQTQPPRYLYALRPDRMTIKPGDSKALVGGYVYDVSGQSKRLDARDVLHLKDFHPLDDFYGLSRLEVAAKSIDISNWSQEWNLKLLQNDMRPPGILKLQGLSEAQSARLRDQLQRQYYGAENAGKTLVIENATDAEWTQASITPRDADWLDSDKANLRKMCGVFNVASELLGDSENKTYSNIQEARRALYTETVLPEMDGLTSALNRWLVPLYGDGIVLGYDRDGIEALQEEREKKYSYLATADWLTVNEKRTACGYDEIADGDVVMVPMGVMPLADATAPIGSLAGEGGEKMARKSIGGFWRGEVQRKALWQNFERRVTAKERAFAREVAAFLAAQAKAAAAKVGPGTREATALLDKDEAVKDYIAKFTPRYRKLYMTALAAGRRMTEGKLYEFDEAEDDKADGGWTSEETRKKLQQLIKDAALVITDETIAEIQLALDGVLTGTPTVQEIANAIVDKVGETMSPMRGRRIAATEVALLENTGNVDGFNENEFVTGKGWLCSFLEHSREAHMAADGDEVGKDELFTVDGEKLWCPADRSHGASAGNVVNCKCAVYPISD